MEGSKAAATTASCDDGGLFPEDLIFHILSWLPVASLLRFKSVCKSWYALVNTRAFIHLHHHNHSLNNNYSDILLNAQLLSGNGVRTYLIQDENFEVFKELDPPDIPHPYVPGSLDTVICDGVVCICCKFLCFTNENEREFVWDVFLWNPATKQFRALPRLPQPVSAKIQHFVSLGFGFDAKINDYKVVLVFNFHYDANSRSSRVATYDLSTDSWRTVDEAVLPADVTYITAHPRSPHRIGTYSWFGRGDPPNLLDNHQERLSSTHCLLSFDFDKKVFETMSLPDSSSVKSDPNPQFGILKGNIACINLAEPHLDGFRHFEIWVLNEYGIKESWTKVYTVGPFFRPLGFSKNEEILLFEMNKPFETSKQICIYDLTTLETKKLLVLESRNAVEMLQVAVYKESLVLINR